MQRNVQKGFTIIETLVYLALFGIMIGGITAAAYMLFETSDRNQTKAMLQEEKNFLVGKIDLTMEGTDPSKAITPSVSGTSLSITKYGSATANTIALSGTDLQLNGRTLNNANVFIKDLMFVHTFTGASNPESIEAGFTISARTPEGFLISQTASTTVYIRK